MQLPVTAPRLEAQTCDREIWVLGAELYNKYKYKGRMERL